MPVVTAVLAAIPIEETTLTIAEIFVHRKVALKLIASKSLLQNYEQGILDVHLNLK